MKTYIQLVEELDAKQKAAVDKWEKPSPKVLARTDHFFGKNKHDVHEPITSDVHKSEIHANIERHLGQEIHPDKYKSGTTTDKYGREVKIGKLLAKSSTQLQHDFENDATRQSKHEHALTVHISRDPHMVAGQTSGKQSWVQQSCKNFDTGKYKAALPHEVKHGSVVAYLKDHKGNELARKTFHPHANPDGDVVYVENSHYGINHAGFNEHGHTIANRLSPPPVAGHKQLFKIHPKVYDDAKHGLVIHPQSTPEQITKVLHDEDPEVRLCAIKHHNATEQHIATAIKDTDETVARHALTHPKVTAEHITAGLKDKRRAIQLAAISHPDVTADHITHALKHGDEYTREVALGHDHVTSEHLAIALKDKNENTRAEAMKHHKVTAEQLTAGLKDKSPYVRYAVANHHKATKEHYEALEKDTDADVRNKAKHHLVRLIFDKLAGH